MRLWLAVGLGLAVAGCGSSGSVPNTEVVYGVTGSGCNVSPQTATIVYEEGGSPIFLQDQPLPWNTAFSIPVAAVNGFPVFLSAANLCAIGSINANVEVNGSLFANQTSFAPYGAVQIAVNLF